MWVWEHALFNYNPKRPDSTKKDKTVEVITKADHDAALRRAKAEVLRELTQSLTYTRFNSYEQGMCERGCGLTKEGKIGASIGLAWALGEIDARAAQIEEGEDLK